VPSSSDPTTPPQLIPRPADARPGRPAPWAQLPSDRRRGIAVRDVEAALLAAGRGLSASTPPDPLDELTGVPATVTDGLRDAAVLVALFEVDGLARVVLTRRAGHLRRHRGEVAFPGGRVEPGEAPLTAALREAHEEVGLAPSVVRPLAWLSPLVTFASGSFIRPYVATLDEPPVLVPEPGEVERAFDVSIDVLLADGVFHEERWRRSTPRPGASPDGSFPIFFYEVAGEIVWGATARILTELCCVVAGVATH
jgi:8-oxo-dGTP pyrophosphatase MutT (NUDIX family)